MKHNRRRQHLEGMLPGKKALVVASVASMISQFLLPDIRLLQELGYEVHVMCNFKKGNTCDRTHLEKLEKELQNMQVVRHHWDCPRNIGCVLQCLRAFGQLWRLTGRQKFFLIHCHSPIGGVLARLATHGRKIRVVYTAHGFHFYKGAPVKNWLLYYPVEKLLSYWTDALVTVNREDFRFAEKNLSAGNVSHIPGVGIDTSCVRQMQSDRILSEKYHIPPGAKILLSVGELNRGKNHRMVIRALARLKERDVYYLICGQGRLKKELWRYADRLGVARRVRMPGYQEAIQQIYPYADIFVFPSVREGMSVALMEAMAAGLVCVVSDIRGNRELITDKRLRFSTEDPGKLARVLEKLLADPQLRCVCGKRNQIKIQGYSRKIVLQKMRKLYQDMEKRSASE